MVTHKEIVDDEMVGKMLSTQTAVPVLRTGSEILTVSYESVNKKAKMSSLCDVSRPLLL